MYDKYLIENNETLTSLKIEITSKCNWNCEHCYVSYRESDKFNIENLALLFEQFRRTGNILTCAMGSLNSAMGRC